MKRGSKMTLEQRKRGSEGHKGKRASKLTRLKMSLSHKGHKPWNKGVPQTLEAKEKNRLSHLGSKAYWYGKKIPKSIKLKMSKNRRGKYTGKNSPSWRGGRTISGDGYVLIKNLKHPYSDKNNYIREHRLIIEMCLGRYLKLTEVVHHINEIRHDNRIKNLILFISNSAHCKFHRNPNNIKPEEILFDGRKY